MIQKINNIRKTALFDVYFKFAFERQDIFFRRITSPVISLTLDPILSCYKFTNAYRASDRVSQFLIRNVIYKGSPRPKEIFFRLILFKIFNKIETWQNFERNLGGQIEFKDYSFKNYDSLLQKWIKEGKKIYSGAYIMPSGKSSFGAIKKHQNHLRLIELMIKTHLPEKITDAKSLGEIYGLFLKYPTLGPFLAYQYAIDVAYSELTSAKEDEFVIAGPGARDGIKKCFLDAGGLSDSDVIRYMVDIQEREFERLGLEFKSLWGRRLQLIDCQNLFCEVDKYSRISHPHIKGISGRQKIKQKFKLNPKPIHYWYPPKWNINHLIN